MTSKTRREMIKAIASGAAFAAPTILTLAAPSHLVAQGPSGMMMMMGGGMMMGMPTFAPNFAPPPGTVDPDPPPGGAR